MKDPYLSIYFSDLTYFNRNPFGFLTEALLTSLAGVIQYLNTHSGFISLHRWSVATSSNNHIYSLTRFKTIYREIQVVNPDSLERAELGVEDEREEEEKLDHSEKSEEWELEKENKTNNKTRVVFYILCTIEWRMWQKVFH